MRGLLHRSIRPPDPVTPNDNDPPPSPGTVGPPSAAPGDPNGIELVASAAAPPNPPIVVLASAWSGWPAEWWPPDWNRVTALSRDRLGLRRLQRPQPRRRSRPYLVNAAPTLDAGWLLNPDPEIYSSWEEFAKQLFWDYQADGEAFVFATARYSTGWPARFHVLPSWTVNVEMRGGRRHYTVGAVDITDDVFHIRYQSSVDDARGHGPLEAGRSILNAAADAGPVRRTRSPAGGLVPSSHSGGAGGDVP